MEGKRQKNQLQSCGNNRNILSASEVCLYDPPDMDVVMGAEGGNNKHHGDGPVL